MKNILITLAILFANSFTAKGQNKDKEDSIDVKGNCIMCKRRIETAMDLNGIKFSEWNVKTKKLFIAYRPDKISEKEIHKALANAGHDTNLVKAADTTNADLPFCCLYRDHDPHGPNGEELH